MIGGMKLENPIKDKKFIPIIESKLRKRIVEVPKEIYEASGINIFGKRIKSLIFSTDVAIIKNSNAPKYQNDLNASAKPVEVVPTCQEKPKSSLTLWNCIIRLSFRSPPINCPGRYA